MAKRTRGSRVAPRPGQRTSTNRPPTAPRTPAPSSAAPAATIISSSSGDLIVEDALAAETTGAAIAPASASADIRRSTPGRVKVKPNSLLAARAETEYVYVGQDLRRIAVVAAGLFGVMLVLWLLLVVVGVAGIY